MPRVQWPLRHSRPCVQVVLTRASDRQPLTRTLLADTGAGSRAIGFEIILVQADCQLCGGISAGTIKLTGSYSGDFPAYLLLVQLPALHFAQRLRAVGVPSLPKRFEGIAGFPFLNRFTFGNFGDPGQFGLEC
jgi:hypothetical protein